MPIANVSDIVGRRDLVAEAQGWSDQMIKWKKLKMMQEEHKEKTKPKPYKFDLAEFGTDNEAMLGLQEDLNNQAYQFAMANADVLRIDPYSEDCGPNCKRAHNALNNMKGAAKIFNTYGNDLKDRYDYLSRLYHEQGDLYGNSENAQKLVDMPGLWKQGMAGETYNFTFGPDGRLMVDVKKRKQTQKIQTDPDGNPVLKDGQPVKMYIAKDGNTEGTEDPSRAEKGKDGNPLPFMVDMDTGQDTDFEVTQKSFGNFLTDLGFNDVIKNTGAENFDKTVFSYSKMVDFGTNETTGAKNYEDHERTSKQKMEAFIFGGSGSWNNTTGTGDLASHSRYLEKLVQQDKEEADDATPITKQDLIDKAYELGKSSLTGKDTKKTTQAQTVELYNLDIPGVNYKTTVDYDNNGSVIQSAKIEDGESVSYPFQGKSFATGSSTQNYISLSHTVNPNTTTLTTGDNNFQTVNSNTALDSFEKPRDFRTGTIGIAPFYVDPTTGKGRALSQQDLKKLQEESPELAKNIQFKVALYGNIVFSGTSEKKKLGNLGIQYTETQDSKGLLVPAIVEAGFYEERIKDIRSSTDPSKTSRNIETYDNLTIQATNQTKAFLDGLTGDVQNQNQQNNNPDPLGIL